VRRAELHGRSWRWVRDRWFVFFAAAIALPIAIVTIPGPMYWPGRIFPGFFVLGNGIVPTVSVYDWTGSTVPFLRAGR
jgi:hypothetical protein